MMPLLPSKSRKAIANNFHELYADNKKEGKARGAMWTPRSRKQIIAIALWVTKRKAPQGK